MIDTNELRGLIAKRGLSQRKVAEHIGLGEKTFYLRMKKGIFNSLEMSAMIKLLDIKDPASVFFSCDSNSMSDNRPQWGTMEHDESL